jgi:hypothetical protein
MSDRYLSFTMRAEEAAPIASALKSLGRTAFVSPASDGFVVFYDAAAETGDAAAITGLACAVSQTCGSAVLAVLNEDDEVLTYWVCDGGNVADRYCSNPGWLEGSDEKPSGGNADTLAAAIAADADRAALSAILSAPNDGEDSDYPFAVDRHVAICEELGLHAEYCTAGFTQVLGGDPDIPDLERFHRLAA